MAWPGKGSAPIPDDSTSTFLTIPIRQGASRLWVGFTNSADSALDAFAVAVRAGNSDAAPYATVAVAASDYVNSIQGPIEGCDADLTSLDKSASGTLWMEVLAVQDVRFQASAAGTSDTTLSYWWSVR